MPLNFQVADTYFFSLRLDRFFFSKMWTFERGIFSCAYAYLNKQFLKEVNEAWNSASFKADKMKGIVDHIHWRKEQYRYLDKCFRLID